MSWGDIDFEKRKLIFPPLKEVEFQLYPVTEFVKDHLPQDILFEEITYAWMDGKGIDDYEDWVVNSAVPNQEMHPFELGLLELIRRAGEATIMFAPEGERLGNFVTVEPAAVVELLRLNVKDIIESAGFLATVNSTCPIQMPK